MQVSEASFSSRASAATRSPASRVSTSPTTRPVARISTRAPSRSTLAFGAVINLSAAMDFSALNSW
jgi:hypothetical protein